MNKDVIVRLHSSFEAIVFKDEASGVECWMARDLQVLLGYARWESFVNVIDRAVIACQNSGYDPNDHFRPATKMVGVGSGARREIEDVALTRYACYLIAQNGDSSKGADRFRPNLLRRSDAKAGDRRPAPRRKRAHQRQTETHPFGKRTFGDHL